MTTLVFLHIPKTAGQTIHHQLASVVGKANVSPIRTHTQALNAPQMPAGYTLYSGHLDWTELNALPQDRFVFTVLRDPKERIASFYFYLRKEAASLSRKQLQDPKLVNKRRCLDVSADEYFLGGDDRWQSFILDHYDNFYCSYFATSRMRGRSRVAELSEGALLERAEAGLGQMDAIYHTQDLTPLERDMNRLLGAKLRIVGNRTNTGDGKPGERRWPRLMEICEDQATRDALAGFAARDEALLARLNR